MKLLIVLALIGAAFASPVDEAEPIFLGEAPIPSDEVEPVMISEVDIPEFVDFGVAYVPESVAREVGLDGSFDEPSPVQFVDEPSPVNFVDEPSPDNFVDEPSPVNFVDNSDIQDFIYEAPVDAPVDESSNIAPGELEAVRVEDISGFDLDPTPFLYDVKPEEPVFVDAPESLPNDRVQMYDDPTWR